jgi:hypothetical protein
LRAQAGNYSPEGSEDMSTLEATQVHP